MSAPHQRHPRRRLASACFESNQTGPVLLIKFKLNFTKKNKSLDNIFYLLTWLFFGYILRFNLGSDWLSPSKVSAMSSNYRILLYFLSTLNDSLRVGLGLRNTQNYYSRLNDSIRRAEIKKHPRGNLTNTFAVPSPRTNRINLRAEVSTLSFASQLISHMICAYCRPVMPLRIALLWPKD